MPHTWTTLVKLKNLNCLRVKTNKWVEFSRWIFLLQRKCFTNSVSIQFGHNHNCNNSVCNFGQTCGNFKYWEDYNRNKKGQWRVEWSYRHILLLNSLYIIICIVLKQLTIFTVWQFIIYVYVYMYLFWYNMWMFYHIFLIDFFCISTLTQFVQFKYFFETLLDGQSYKYFILFVWFCNRPLNYILFVTLRAVWGSVTE